MVQPPVHSTEGGLVAKKIITKNIVKSIAHLKNARIFVVPFDSNIISQLKISTMNSQQIQLAVKTATGIYNITDARKAVTGDLAKQMGIKKEDAAQLVFSIAEKRRSRRMAATSGKNISLLDSAAKRICARFKKVLPLRVSESSWAGGDYYDVKIARRFDGVWKFSQWDKAEAISHITVNSWKEWSGNGKWSGNATRHTLHLVPSDTFQVIGGLITIFKKRDAAKSAKECTWYEQARGFDIREMHGFLVDGYHIEKSEKIETLEQAIAEVQRRARAAKMENILTARGVMRAFHFCESGVRNFCEQNGIDFTKARLTREELTAIVSRDADRNRQNFGTYLTKLEIKL